MIHKIVGKKRISPKTITFFKFVVAVGLSIFILYKADWQNIKVALQHCNLWLIALVAISMVLNIIVSTMKWQALLVIHEIRVDIKKLAKYYFTGMFISNFLPSTIGGDGYRIYKIHQITESKSGAIIPVFVERLAGMMILLLMGFVGAIISYIQYRDDISLMGLFFGLIGISSIVFFLYIILSKKTQAWILKKNKIPQKIKTAVKSIDKYRSHKKFLYIFFFLSVTFTLLMLFNRFVLLIAIGEYCSIFSLSVAIMISTVVALIPISINGIGILDGSFIYLVSRFGVSYENALIFMLLQRSLSTGISLIGSYFYYTDRSHVSNKNKLYYDQHHADVKLK